MNNYLSTTARKPYFFFFFFLSICLSIIVIFNRYGKFSQSREQNQNQIRSTTNHTISQITRFLALHPYQAFTLTEIQSRISRVGKYDNLKHVLDDLCRNGRLECSNDATHQSFQISFSKTRTPCLESDILPLIINNKIPHIKYMVNFGAGHYGAFDKDVDPTYKFFNDDSQNWKGLMIEANEKSVASIKQRFPHQTIVQSYITPDNVLDLCESAGVPEEGFFAKIDIDGYDGQVMQVFLSKYSPLVIQMEINAEIPPPIIFSVTADSDFGVASGAAGFFGCSLSFVEVFLAKPFGYTIITIDSTCSSHDVILVRNDILPAIEEQFNVPRDTSAMWHFLAPHNRDSKLPCWRFAGKEACSTTEECKCSGLDCRDMSRLAERAPLDLFKRMFYCLREKSKYHNIIAKTKGSNESSFVLALESVRHQNYSGGVRPHSNNNKLVGAAGQKKSIIDESQRVNFPFGGFAYVNKSATFGNGNFWENLEKLQWEPSTFQSFQASITPDTTVIDFGSWIGPTALFASTLAKAVIAMEPDSAAFQTLTQNVALNPHLNIKALRKCVSPIHEEVTMRAGGIMQGDSMSQVERGGHSKSKDGVQCSPLLAIIEEHNLHPPLFIKIDVEGMEAEIVPSWKSWIPKLRPTIFLSMHQHLRQYKDSEKKGVLEVLSLFPYVYLVTDCLDCKGKFEKVIINPSNSTLCEKCDYLASFSSKTFLPLEKAKT